MSVFGYLRALGDDTFAILLNFASEAVELVSPVGGNVVLSTAVGWPTQVEVGHRVRLEAGQGCIIRLRD